MRQLIVAAFFVAGVAYGLSMLGGLIFFTVAAHGGWAAGFGAFLLVPLTLGALVAWPFTRGAKHRVSSTLRYLVYFWAGFIVCAISSAWFLNSRESRSYPENRAAAADQLRNVRERYNAKQFGEIYDSADPVLRSSIGRAAFVAQFAQTYERFGPLTNAVQKREDCFPHLVMYVFHSRFGSEEATEYLDFMIRNRKAALERYEVVVGLSNTERGQRYPCDSRSLF